MDTIGPRQIELKLHGLTREDHGRVPGRLFATKLTQLINALEAADTIANGDAVHDYVLSNMHMSEPTAILSEIPREFENAGVSAIPTFSEAVDCVKVHDAAKIARLAPVVKRISSLTGGAESRFGFAEIRTGNEVIRVDDFLRRRALAAKKSTKGPWYEGVAYGSFDGMLDYVDVRGAVPQVKLTLSAGGKEIDCVCRREDIDDLGAALNHRVRVYGKCIYASASPLPIRVEVNSIEPVKPNGDLARWVGSFRPFAIDSWDGDA
ncbi:hypothetical protein [Novosphingobium sp. B-7]|uniref:hypothetical protein n=1 Tax=Novosphingobium sp. B-7 TaxID=1298855 RepID=UPI0011D2ACE2|nr:hypothetical protein [Novosphingobium sp. B-7]